ncbi:MAG: ATPase, partial [Actinobacteria bacterium]|nr:ATPase [Actinomycetota bacterium]
MRQSNNTTGCYLSAIPMFTRKAKRQTASHPKFYFFDTGLYNALRP